MKKQKEKISCSVEKSHKPELVAPAGDWPSLRAAVENGADSVYFGVKGLNMRELAANFDVLELKKIMEYLRKNSCKGYLALNVIVMNKELPKVGRILHEAKAAGVDAVILWDMAVLSLARELGLRVHLSTQASVSNTEAVSFYARLGVRRVILARECTLEDIREIAREIKAKKISCEIETFIHGAMCVSISGRCFLSQYSFGKSANRGNCLQPCRREFLITDKDKESEYIVGEDYLLSPKDLCSIDFLDELLKAGIDSFKIEGRMRSPEYVKAVTSAYRKGIDAFARGKLTAALKKKLKEPLCTVYNRGFSDGFYFGPPQKAVSRRPEHLYERVYLGDVRTFYKRISVAEVVVRNGTLRQGMELLFVGKKTPALRARVKELEQEHRAVKSADPGGAVGVKLPFVVNRGDKVFLWKKKTY